MKKQNILLTLIIIFFLAQEITFASELPITVLICSYNNEQWVEKNLNSIMHQKYSHFKVLYIDDCSSDNTATLVQSYIDTHTLHDTITLVRNQTRCRKMKNIYNGVHACNDYDIIVQLDGDDWFIHDGLFQEINHLYQTKDIWLTYGSDTLGYAQPTTKKTIYEQTFRQEKWIYAPTRSFYAWLFKAIKLEDFIAEHVKEYQGLFFPSADDVAFMYPMLEMAGHRFAFIPHVNYKVNTHNPLSNKKIEYDLQEASSLDVRLRPPYKPLLEPSIHQKVTADVIIISDDASALKESNALLPSHMLNAGSITIMYTAQHTEHAALAASLSDYHFVAIHNENIKNSIQEYLYQTPHDFVILIQGHHHISKPIDVAYYTTLLAKTGAYAFYFTVSAQHASLPLQHLFDDVYVWKLIWSEDALHNACDILLLRKKDFLNEKSLDAHAVGLCLKQSVLKQATATVSLHLPYILIPQAKPKKKRRLHVPGVDPRTKKNKSKRDLKKETSYV